MKAKLRHDPNREDLPISSLAEYINKDNVHIVRMQNEVEELIFPSASLNNNQIARYSVKGFDFRIPVRAAKEKDKRGVYVADFPPVDFQGHANVEVSQFFGNIFSNVIIYILIYIVKGNNTTNFNYFFYYFFN